MVSLVKHQRRVGLVLWHPSAQNILLSAGSDNNVVIWNVGTGEALLKFALPDLVYSGCWNWDGSEVLFTCKDRKIRRVDPRYGQFTYTICHRIWICYGRFSVAIIYNKYFPISRMLYMSAFYIPGPARSRRRPWPTRATRPRGPST